MSDEKATSPIIGVLLIVLVALILSALVASFSFNITHSTKNKAPDALIEFVSLKRNLSAEDYADGFYIKFLHKGGDQIPFKEMRVIIKVHGEHDGWVPQDFSVVLGSYTKDANGVYRHAEYPEELWSAGDYLLIKTVKEYNDSYSGGVALLNGEKEVLLGLAITEGHLYSYEITVKFIHWPSKSVIGTFNLYLPEKVERGSLVR